MRTSNLFIYGSLTVIAAASVGYLLYSTLGGQGGKDSSSEMASRIEKLEKENGDLVDQAKRDQKQIASLNTDLQKASKLNSEKDFEISQLHESILKLKEEGGTDQVATALAPVLNCQPEEVSATVNKLVLDYQTVHKQLEVVNGQLSNLMAKGDSDAENNAKNSEDRTNDADPPRIKKLELSAPANQWANRNATNGNATASPAKNDPKGKPDEAKPEQKPLAPLVENKTEIVSDTNQPSIELVNSLTDQIQLLKTELANREKLLFEQTSLIEDLKKKSRIETGLRTENNTMVVVPVKPFREVGTFPIKSN